MEGTILFLAVCYGIYCVVRIVKKHNEKQFEKNTSPQEYADHLTKQAMKTQYNQQRAGHALGIGAKILMGLLKK